MSKILFIIVFSGIIEFLTATPAAADGTNGACVTPPSGLVGWWKGEDNANDSAGADNGALSPTGATYAPGMVGQAFHFDGSNGFVQIPDSAALKPAAVTIEAWVWLDPGLTNHGGEQIVFKKNTWSAYFEGYSLLKYGDGISPDVFEFCVSSHGDQVPVYGLTAVQRGAWYHVAATYDGSEAILYVNGVADGSATAGFPLDYDTTPLFIGTTGTWPPYLSMFGGVIDEVSLYDRALSPEEIKALYSADSAGKCPPGCTTPPSGLVAMWKGEDNVIDSTGTNNGTLSASGATYGPGMVGRAFRFDGTNGFAQIPDSPVLKPAAVSIEAWVWLDPSLPAEQGGEQIVFKKNTWSAYFEGYSLLKYSDGIDPDVFEFCVSRNGDQRTLYSQTIAERGVWHHVAATYDGTNIALYINGEVEDSGVAPFPLDYDTTPLFIGTTGTWQPYLNMFGGMIDEVSIYSRALSSNEIAAIYSAGAYGKCVPETAQDKFLNPQNAGGNLNAEFAGAPGVTYTIESAVSLGGPWTKVANFQSPLTDQGLGAGVFAFSTPATNSAQFFRAVCPAY